VALLKSYFQHPGDSRDRLRAEFSFSQFAWENGLRCLPRPLASDAVSHLGLYEFIDGRRMIAPEITENAVAAAMTFYSQLNQLRSLPQAQRLPIASEACFSISEHLELVTSRVARLKQIGCESELDREAAAFANELTRVWQRVVQQARRQAAAAGLAMSDELPSEHRRLSPSDFGFHNAIFGRDGHLRFIDFEYAGWDDPAKVACDFFCQPELPVPLSYFDKFVDGITADLPAFIRPRIDVLLPVYQIKWCCIRLNHFVPIDGRRRQFAHSGSDLNEVKRKQLAEARAALRMLNS
jgi:hypothetical protein